MLVALALTNCKPPAPVRAPDSAESLCRETAQLPPRSIKLPSVEGLRDNLGRGQAHVDLETMRKAVAVPVRPETLESVSEDDVRRLLIAAGGGVIVHWQPPVNVRVMPLDPKARASSTAVYGAAIADPAGSQEHRELYLLEREPGETKETWRRYFTAERDPVCS